MPDLQSLLYALTPWGTHVLLWVQAWRTPWLDILFVTASLDRNGAAFALVLPLVLWCVNRALGIELLYLNVAAQFVTATIKLSLAIPRPHDPALIPLSGMPHTCSFPSGHAQMAVTLFGYLALRTRNPWLRALCIALVPLIAFSRVYVGAHYPQDVIGGIVIGLLCLLLFVWLYPCVHSWVSGRGTNTLIVLSILGSALPLLFGLGLPGIDGLMDPALRASGLLAGTSVGLVMCRGCSGTVCAARARSAVRLVVGLLVLGMLFGLWWALDLCIPGAASFRNLTTWISFASAGWGLVCGVPWLLKRRWESADGRSV